MVCGGSVFEGRSRLDKCPKCGSKRLREVPLKGKTGILYLRQDQAFQLLEACRNLKETLAIRYFMFNGLSPMELSRARIEHLDPVDRILYLPKRHWKKNETADIDSETVKLQIIYSGDRKKGPLLRSRRTGGHLTKWALYALVKRVALRTLIPGKEFICPLILKRTFGRLFLQTTGNTVLGLQRAFSHKHIWSTGHYLKYVLDDVKIEKGRMMDRLARAKDKQKMSV